MLKEEDFALPEFFKNVLGVTVNPDGKTERVLLFADSETARYILTKPIHHSQRAEETLGFGDRVRVLSPQRLKRRIKECLTHALDQYQYELSENALHGAIQKLTYKGFMILHHVFSKKDINQIKSRIDYYLRTRNEENVHTIRNVWGKFLN